MPPTLFDFALVIPCYNEERRIPSLLTHIRGAFGTDFWKDKRVAVIFVDDGSQDQTGKLLERFSQEKHARFVPYLLQLTKNTGKGAAIVVGCGSIEAHAYGFTDADLAFGLDVFEDFLPRLSSADMVVARRIRKEGDTFVRRTVSRFLRWLTHKVTGMRVHDSQSGCKVFTREVVQTVFPTLHQTRFSFDAELVLQLEALAYRIKEVDTPCMHDERSSVRVHDGVRYLIDLLAITDRIFKPRPHLLSQFALLSFIVTALCYGWVIWYGYFFSDDFTWLWFGKRIVEQPNLFWSLKAGSFFSPIINGYYAGLMALFGPTASVYFGVNLLVHMVVATLAGLFAFRLSQSRLAGWFAVVLVAFAGGAYEPLIWIGSNMHSFVTLFILLALYGYWRYLETGHSRWLLVSSIGQLLAYGTKETSIVLAPLLLAVFLLRSRVTMLARTSWRHGLFVSATTVLAGLYVYLQFILQEGGKTFSTNRYEVGWQGFLRYPFSIADLFIPIHPLRSLLAPSSATMLFVLIVTEMIFGMYKFRHVPGFLFASAIAAFGVLPPLFFIPLSWWEPLASRYEYLPRVGASLVTALLLSYLIRHNTARRVIHVVVVGLCIAALLQFGFMIKTLRSEYDYIYRTGRTLVEAIRTTSLSPVTRVFIHPPFPFERNHAHILGAFVVFSPVKEERITFLSEPDIVPLDTTRALLYWYPKGRMYEMTKDMGIYSRFPLP